MLIKQIRFRCYFIERDNKIFNFLKILDFNCERIKIESNLVIN